MKQTMTAQEAARELGVSLPTLYAYVSRGLIASEPGPDGRRARRYAADDVRRLRERKASRRDPDREARRAVRWGAPVLDSALTLIQDGQLYYRGRSAVELAETRAVEEVAALVWTGRMDGGAGEARGEAPAAARPLLGRDLPPLDVMQAALALAAAEDAAAWDLRPASVARTGGRILRMVTAVALGVPAIDGSVARALADAWAPGHPCAERLLTACLVLCAEHELNVASFTARCVASAAGTPYAAVAAGMGALQGTRHAGYVRQVQALLAEADASGDARATVADRMRRGERIASFGHRLYPDGDPRGAALLRMADAAFPESDGVRAVREVVDAAGALFGERPNVEVGLIAVARGLELPAGAPLLLFALGRTIGLIGHAIEQYEAGTVIRPRAQYVGEMP
ncbi:MAG TPA: citrate/2-methylcitrate synthase [Longimicrobium sp.]